MGIMHNLFVPLTSEGVRNLTRLLPLSPPKGKENHVKIRLLTPYHAITHLESQKERQGDISHDQMGLFPLVSFSACYQAISCGASPCRQMVALTPRLRK